MFSKELNGIGYATESGLGANTDWMIFPVEIEAMSKNYSDSLVVAGRVWSECVSSIKLEQDVACTLSPLEENVTFKSYKSKIVLKQFSQDQFKVSLSKHFLLKFDSKKSFWDKVKIAASILDKCAAFSLKYRTDKQISVSVIFQKKP